MSKFKNKIFALFLLSLTLVMFSQIILTSAQSAETYAHEKSQNQPDAVIRFAAIGDFGDDSIAANNVASLVQSWNADFIITLGDNRYADKTYDRTVGSLYCNYLINVIPGLNCDGGSASETAFFPSPGNHDYYDGKGAGINEYLDYFVLPGSGITSTNTSGNELYYDFIHGPIHFFVLDSEAAKISSANRAAQQVWLEAQLKSSTTPWQFVYMHHPPYSSGSHGSSVHMRWDYQTWGADAVLAGHDHSYERLHVNGLPYFVNGLGGKSLYDFGAIIPGSELRYNNNYGAMLITATADKWSYQFINLSGTVIDSAVYFANPTFSFLPMVISP